jgi:DNA-binding response OmpR family regulator
MHPTLPVTIVIIEDDPSHARLIARNLRRAYITNGIVTLRDGQEAVAYPGQAHLDYPVKTWTR